jgi:flagellar protein FlbD
VIELHRLGHDGHVFELNPDFVVTIEAHPDTTIVLSTGARIVVREEVEAVVARIRAWRAGILADALEGSNASSVVPLR